MPEGPTGATIVHMAVAGGRGAQIARRRKSYGLSGRKLAELAGGMDPQTLRRAEEDHDSTTEMTFIRLERALDAWEHRISSEAEEVAASVLDDGGERLVEFRVSGNFGVDVIVRGPVSDIEKLEASVAHIIARVQKDEAQ